MDLFSIYISAHPKIPKLFYLVQQVTPNPERTLHPFLTENPEYQLETICQWSRQNYIIWKRKDKMLRPQTPSASWLHLENSVHKGCEKKRWRKETLEWYTQWEGLWLIANNAKLFFPEELHNNGPILLKHHPKDTSRDTDFSKSKKDQ